MSQGKLTRRSFCLLFYPFLVSSGGFAQCFVACGEEDDGDEGENEGRQIVNAPPAEDDTETLSVPVEEHLCLS